MICEACQTDAAGYIDAAGRRLCARCLSALEARARTESGPGAVVEAQPIALERELEVLRACARPARAVLSRARILMASMSEGDREALRAAFNEYDAVARQAREVLR